MKKWIVERRFAWFPVLIRNKCVGFMGQQSWVWFKRYTRVSVYKPFPEPGRYRTYDTVLGWKNYPVPGEES
jgi:hypothetical protein